MTMQRYELEAWLGDDHCLADGQLDELIDIADQLADQYPGPDDEPERNSALFTAYRLMVGTQLPVINDLAQELLSSRQAELAALAGLEQAARQLIPSDEISEAMFAREAGVDRMTVRKWLGKR